MADRARRHPLRSIKARVTLGAVLVVALALSAGAAGGLAILSGSLTSGVEASLELELETLGDRIEEGTFSADDVGDDTLVALRDPRVAAEREDDGEGAQADRTDRGEARDPEDGQDRSEDSDDDSDERDDRDDRDDRPDRIDRDDDSDELPTVAEDRVERVRLDGEPYLVASDRTDAGVLTVGRPLEQVDEAVATAAFLLAVAVPLAVLLIGGVVWIVAGRALAPVERMRRQVDDIDAAGLARRLDGGGAGDEIDRLAGTMNRMLDRIERSQRAQRRFVSDASHELRSPLATMRQHAELAAAHPETTSTEELTQVVLQEGARMQELVEGLLLLARLDEGRARDEGGSGLGLAIVLEVALAHGGSVSVASGESGGAVFTLMLPASPQS